MGKRGRTGKGGKRWEGKVRGKVERKERQGKTESLTH